jgi:hypothetical protein
VDFLDPRGGLRWSSPYDDRPAVYSVGSVKKSVAPGPRMSISTLETLLEDGDFVLGRNRQAMNTGWPFRSFRAPLELDRLEV